MCQNQPTQPACKGKEKKAIHTLGTGMTSTWSHYNTREIDKHIQKQGEGREEQQQKKRRKNKGSTGIKQNTIHTNRQVTTNENICKLIVVEEQIIQFSGVRVHLGRWSVLLNRWREGAGVGIGGWRFHIIVAEAAQECAEDASAPLLL